MISSFIIVIILGLAIFLLIVSRCIKHEARKVRKKHNIPVEKITYSDLNTLAKPLFSKRYQIAGKPDYIIKKNKQYIPVEVKTGLHYELQKNHTFQLATYCQLLEDAYGGLVPYGMIVYNDTGQQYQISFDPKLRFELESTINKMRQELKTGKVVRNHQDLYRCKSCSMRSNCTMKLM